MEVWLVSGVTVVYVLLGWLTGWAEGEIQLHRGVSSHRAIRSAVFAALVWPGIWIAVALCGLSCYLFNHKGFAVLLGPPDDEETTMTDKVETI